MRREFKIYCLYNKITNEVFYVGSTYQELNKRFNDHKKISNKTSVGNYIHNVGKDNIGISILEICDCLDDMYDGEYYCTKYYYRFFNILNLDFGKIHGVSFFHKMSGENNPNFGKHMSEETKAKIRRWVLAHPNSEESYKKGALKRTGRKHSDEWCYNISKGLKKLYDNGYKGNNCKMVRLLNTNEIFSSIKDAELAYNVPATHITACCKGKRKSAGKLDCAKMVWEYVY